MAREGLNAITLSKVVYTAVKPQQISKAIHMQTTANKLLRMNDTNRSLYDANADIAVAISVIEIIGFTLQNVMHF